MTISNRMGLTDDKNKSLGARSLSQRACGACRLPPGYCICAQRPHYQTQVGICLIYHSAEPERTSNTGHLVEECISPCYRFVWSRTQPPPGLLALLCATQWAPQLVFPGEYAATAQPVLESCHAPTGRRPLLLILDATWNQARKMHRQSPYLQQLPCVSLSPSAPSRYRLRRSRREDHLCTSEVAQLCLAQLGEEEAAQGLGAYFDHYTRAWLSARENRRAPAADQ